jgi:hypothetical protein
MMTSPLLVGEIAVFFVESREKSLVFVGVVNPEVFDGRNIYF